MVRLLLVLLVVGVVGGAAWTFRDRIPGPWSRETESVVVSPETAEAAAEKLRRLREEGEPVSLTAAEATSLLRYRLTDRLPDALIEPTVTFAGDTVQVAGRIPSERLPSIRELESLRFLLPDTADVAVRGTLRTLDDRRVGVRVETVKFAGVGVPEQVYPEALARLGRRDEPGVAPDEYPFALPAGVGSARVEGGRLVLAPPAAP